MRRLWIACLVAGCSSPPLSEITLHTGRPFVAAIDRGHGWEVLPDQEDVLFMVDGPFALASACGDTTFIEVRVWLATADDLDDWTMPCRAVPGDYHDIVFRNAEGTVGRNRVSLSWYSFELLDELPRRLELPAQTTDILAVELAAPHRFVLDRDVVIDAPGERVIDMEAAGRPLDTHPVVQDMTAMYLDVKTRVTTHRAELTIAGEYPNPSTAFLLPPDAVRDGDVQEIFVSDRREYEDALTRWVGGPPIGDGPFPAELPDWMSDPEVGMVGGLPVARYDDDRAWPVRQLGAFLAFIDQPGQWYWSARAWPGWVDGAGEDGVFGFPDVTTIPGWDPAWNLGPGVPVELDLMSASDDSGLRTGFHWDGSISSP